jgi:hypothetical protein
MDSHEILSMADERFERRLTQESAALRQEIAGVRQEVVLLRLDMDARFDAVDARIKAQFDAANARFATREEMAVGFARIEQRIAESRAELVKWSFLFWTGQCITMIGFLLVFLKNR